MALALAGWLAVSSFLPAGQENLGRARISGDVVDEEGQPIAGATVVAQSLKGETKLAVQSNKKGHFAIAGLGTGMWHVTASKEGFVDSVVEMNVSQLRANPPILLTLKRMTGPRGLQADSAGIETIDQGNALIEKGEYDAAITLFETFLADYPDVFQIRLNIGSAYLKKGDMERAEAEFRGVLDKITEVHGDLQKDPATATRALSALGELHLKLGNQEKGQEYFRGALEISPEDETAAYNVGEIFFSNQQIDEAITYFEMAAKIKRDWPKPYYKLGFVYLNKGDIDKSLENFKKFVELDPQNPEIPNVRNIMLTIEKMKKSRGVDEGPSVNLQVRDRGWRSGI